jgi:sulfate transport system substrate-binding protein
MDFREMTMTSNAPHSLSQLGSRFGRLLSAGLLALSFGAVLAPSGAVAQTRLLNVSYDPTREFYKEFNAEFAKSWKAKTGEDVRIDTSHGGSGKQARAVIDGLDADVVTLALAADIDAIAEKTRKIPADWQTKLPNNSTPYTSTIIFVVKKGNPKGIKDWADLVKPGVEVITSNPKTSGGARWAYLGAWAWARKTFNGDDVKIRDYVGTLYSHVPVLDTGARGATTTFAERDIGDVLLSWENEAFLTLAEFGADKYDIVYPAFSIKAEPPVALVTGNAEKKGTLKQASAYLDFLYAPEGQKLAAKHFFRPSNPTGVDPEVLKRYPALETVDITSFGGWTKAQKDHFSDGGVFDQIYKAAK